ARSSRLKGQTNVALFGPRDTGKTTFTNQLALELAKAHGDDAPPFDVVKINLQRVVSIPGFIGCVHDAVVGHPSRLHWLARFQVRRDRQAGGGAGARAPAQPDARGGPPRWACSLSAGSNSRPWARP